MSLFCSNLIWFKKSCSLVFSNYRSYSSIKTCKLASKAVISVTGQDTYRFLQGLITNDVRCLYSRGSSGETTDCIYALVLYPNGRVLTDIFIYDREKASSDSFSENEIASKRGKIFVECDRKISEKLCSHFKRYKLRSKVELNINEPYNVWAIFPDKNFPTNLPTSKSDYDADFFFTSDPRVKDYFRVLTHQSVEVQKILEDLLVENKLPFQKCNESDYIQQRYSQGIGEGYDDFPDTKCFPLECNGDFLNAINFHKGCYVGQELTARVHHTGVVRKRLTPIRVANNSSSVSTSSLVDQPLFLCSNDKKIGKIRSMAHILGLGLVLTENLDPQKPIKAYVKHNDQEKLEFEIFKPSWWPTKNNSENKVL